MSTDRDDEPLRRLRLALDAAQLAPDVVNSIWTQVLAASSTASTRAPAVVTDPKRIVVVGAHGGMGQLFTRLLRALGHRVVPVDLLTRPTALEAAPHADVVIITVPIGDTERVIRDIGPALRDDALLLDFTSLKSEPLRWMLESTRASVVGAHPMFGPGVLSCHGQRVVLCEGRGAAWLRWATDTFAALGATVMLTEPDRHDRAMALVQVLTHFQTQVLGLTLARYGVPIDEPLAFTSPAYLLELYVTARHFAQSAALYGPIEMLNPETSKVTATFQAAASEVSTMLANRDQVAFDALFAEVSAFFGSFTHEAVDQSGFLIDRLAELTNSRPRK